MSLTYLFLYLWDINVSGIWISRSGSDNLLFTKGSTHEIESGFSLFCLACILSFALHAVWKNTVIRFPTWIDVICIYRPIVFYFAVAGRIWKEVCTVRLKSIIFEIDIKSSAMREHHFLLKYSSIIKKKTTMELSQVRTSAKDDNTVSLWILNHNCFTTSIICFIVL